MEEFLKKIYASLERLLDVFIDKNPFNSPNLEIEEFAFPITSAGLNKMPTRQTKAEHDMLLGVFTSYKGNGADLLGSKFRITVGNETLVSRDYLEFMLIEKTSYIGVKHAAWRTEKHINSSDVNIEFDNQTGNVGFTVNFYFITRKKKH